MTPTTSSSRGIGRALVDDGLAWILATLAAAGSFTHIRDLAIRSGQHGWMADAIAVCIDLMCVMAVRERKRDQRSGRHCGRLSWPTAVLTMGICLTIAANLASAQPTPWGWIVAATPATTFLIAVSMLERRTSPSDQSKQTDPPDRLATDTGPTEVRPVRPADRTELARPGPGDSSPVRTPQLPVNMTGPKRRSRATEIEVRARAVLARRPEVTGADLGRELGVTERHGRRLLNRLAPAGG